MSVMNKLKKNSRIKKTDTLLESSFFGTGEMVSTSVPMINVALSGSIDGGLTPGLTILSGPSKHFKTSFALLMASAYLQKHEDAVLLFYDSEFGSPQSYFESFEIDPSRVLHTPVTNIEELKFDLVNQLDSIEDSDKVVIVIDSIGNIASKKEVEDALNEKSVADMTRAKALKGLFRMVTPYLTMKSIPMLGIAHTYATQEIYSKQVVSGGTGITYSANTVWIIGRQQDKDGKEVKGYHFIINVEKSRFVKEKSKIPISVSWDGGIEEFSGLLPLALLSGHVTKPSQGWYCRINTETGEEIYPKVREKDTMNKEFWDPILKDSKFNEFLRGHYMIGYRSMIDAEELPDDLQPEEE